MEWSKEELEEKSKEELINIIMNLQEELINTIMSLQEEYEKDFFPGLYDDDYNDN